MVISNLTERSKEHSPTVTSTKNWTSWKPYPTRTIVQIHPIKIWVQKNVDVFWEILVRFLGFLLDYQHFPKLTRNPHFWQAFLAIVCLGRGLYVQNEVSDPTFWWNFFDFSIKKVDVFYRNQCAFTWFSSRRSTLDSDYLTTNLSKKILI